MSYRLGVDVGGTFTDLLVIDEATGRTFRDKVPSTPHDPSEAVVAGARKLTESAGIAPGSIELFLHGTTVATNAVLEGKFARVGLVVTEGYRHMLQIARSLVPGGLAAWIVWPKPEPMAPLEATIEAPERIGADGEIVRALDEAELRRRLETLRHEKVEAITVCLINSYVSDVHERRVAEICAEMFPDLPVSISADILPEMQEYERGLTTVANSAVRPTVSRYVANLERELTAWGTPAKLNLLRSDGGLMSAEKSRAAPVNLLMSGPAGGVAGAVWVAKSAGFPNVLTLDMGGTSTDVALIENYTPRLRRETSVGHLTVRASSLDVKTVGAGGGSIAYVPELTGALRVGPQSAGAVPGPRNTQARVHPQQLDERWPPAGRAPPHCRILVRQVQAGPRQLGRWCRGTPARSAAAAGRACPAAWAGGALRWRQRRCSCACFLSVSTRWRPASPAWPRAWRRWRGRG